MSKFKSKPKIIQAEVFNVDGVWPLGIYREPGIEGGEPMPFFVMTREGKAEIQPGDYLITDAQGGIYPCNPETFARNYEPLIESDLMPFGAALLAMRNGNKVARVGWNGKGMFLFVVPGSTFKVNRAPLLGIYPEGTEIVYGSHIDIKAVDGSVRPWVASQSDMLADDWMIVA